jgi:hypothetical protein
VRDLGVISSVRDLGVISSVRDLGVISSVRDLGVISSVRDLRFISSVRDLGVLVVRDLGMLLLFVVILCGKFPISGCPASQRGQRSLDFARVRWFCFLLLFLLLCFFVFSS